MVEKTLLPEDSFRKRSPQNRGEAEQACLSRTGCRDLVGIRRHFLRSGEMLHAAGGCFPTKMSGLNRLHTCPRPVAAATQRPWSLRCRTTLWAPWAPPAPALASPPQPAPHPQERLLCGLLLTRATS